MLLSFSLWSDGRIGDNIESGMGCSMWVRFRFLAGGSCRFVGWWLQPGMLFDSWLACVQIPACCFAFTRVFRSAFHRKKALAKAFYFTFTSLLLLYHGVFNSH